jgi:hypothetical protein
MYLYMCMCVSKHRAVIYSRETLRRNNLYLRRQFTLTTYIQSHVVIPTYTTAQTESPNRHAPEKKTIVDTLEDERFMTRVTSVAP